ILVGYDGESIKLNSHIIIDSNNLISINEKDPKALQRRYILVAFGPTISEEYKDPKLPERLEKIRESFFIELLLRFPKIDIESIDAPAITNEVLKISESFKNPVRLFLDTCTVPALNIHGGTNVSIGELNRVFKQHFFYLYESRFNGVFFKNMDFHVDLAEISKQRFTIEVEKVYHDITIGHAGAKFVNNILVRDPGNFNTVKEMQIHNLKNVYCVAIDDKTAEKIIMETEKPSIISMPESPNDSGFADVLWFDGCPSFHWLCIPPVQLLWENQLLNVFCFANSNILYQPHLREFINWLGCVIGINKAKESLSMLNGLISNCPNITIAGNNSEIRKILAQFFDIYLKFVRDLRPPKIGSKNPRRICLASQKKELATDGC
ncbi:MAG: hypothetical protein PUJ82_13755, partial [Spirochaetales bacterium]|nr:hypothetical protein [Spirochaetales bacterium]MDY5916224.1 hypothetical protein [Treponema sp.]